MALKTIYAIPGLGTTGRLFQHISVKGAEIVVLKWPEPQKHYNLRDYAREFLKQIDTSRPFYLMGVSFGGMLCAELSKLISPQKIFLISSSKTRRELPRLIRFFKYLPLYKIIPERHHRKMAARSRWFLGFNKSYMPDFLEMIKAMPDHYFTRTIGYIVNWDNAETQGPVVHIHGDADRLLLYRRVKADYTIHHGSHAMIIEQAEAINKILEDEINEKTERKPGL